MLKYKNTSAFYVTNYPFLSLQRNVTALIDSEENAINRYTYDAFGVILASTETVENPFRYAGCRYDSETRLYYLIFYAALGDCVACRQDLVVRIKAYSHRDF